MSHRISRFGKYYFHVINCNSHSGQIAVSWEATFLNQEENQMSSYLIPAPSFFRVMVFVWAISSFFYLVVLRRYWKNASLGHKLVFLFPVFKVPNTAFNLYNYLCLGYLFVLCGQFLYSICTTWISVNFQMGDVLDY